MTADELLATCQVYRLMFATHSLMRHVGFDADDIYSFVGANAGMTLKTQGCEFAVVCCDELPRDHQVFYREWKAIVEGAMSTSDEMMAQCKEEFSAMVSMEGFLQSILRKGIEIPLLDALKAKDRGTMVH